MKYANQAMHVVYGPAVTELEPKQTTAFMEGWTSALECIFSKIPRGKTCDPKVIADEIRELLK